MKGDISVSVKIKHKHVTKENIYLQFTIHTETKNYIIVFYGRNEFDCVGVL